MILASYTITFRQPGPHSCAIRICNALWIMTCDLFSDTSHAKTSTANICILESGDKNNSKKTIDFAKMSTNCALMFKLPVTIPDFAPGLDSG